MWYRPLISLLLILTFGLLTACSDGSMADMSAEELTYDQIVNTGLANNCPELEETTRGTIELDPNRSYLLTNLCLQPSEFFVKEESINKRREAEFVAAKQITRRTTTIDQVQGNLKFTKDGELSFIEQDGFDFQPITVQLPGGEQFPFLFTVKELVASAPIKDGKITTSTDFEGDFKVPSYRTSNFLDPKGRGLTAGYDNAVALPARSDSEELVKENVKRFALNKGHISLQVTKIDSQTGEIAGNFISEQPTQTDMGSKEPADVKIKGRFYARIEADLA